MSPQAGGMGGDDRFWTLFGGIWLLVGLGFVAAGLGVAGFADPAAIEEPALPWIFLAIGGGLAVAGGLLVRRARRLAARDRRLLQTGIELAATVTDLRLSPVRINRQSRWHVVYGYEYTRGRPLAGESRALPGAAVEGFKPGDRVRIKVDPRRPEESLFLGAG